jgi:hypothetical protein
MADVKQVTGTMEKKEIIKEMKTLDSTLCIGPLMIWTNLPFQERCEQLYIQS